MTSISVQLRPYSLFSSLQIPSSRKNQLLWKTAPTKSWPDFRANAGLSKGAPITGLTSAHGWERARKKTKQRGGAASPSMIVNFVKFCLEAVHKWQYCSRSENTYGGRLRAANVLWFLSRADCVLLRRLRAKHSALTRHRQNLFSIHAPNASTCVIVGSVAFEPYLCCAGQPAAAPRPLSKISAVSVTVSFRGHW